MHDTAQQNAMRFIETYIEGKDKNLLDIGSCNYQEGAFTFKEGLKGKDITYIGADFANGNNVDIVLESDILLPFGDNSIDYVVSSSCFEHCELFWAVYIEIMRVLKPDGLFYLNAPSNGVFHRYPQDCWRFYPDSGKALIRWGKMYKYRNILLESYTSEKVNDIWEDYVAVFLKDETHLDKHPRRIVDYFEDHKYATVHPHKHFIS